MPRADKYKRERHPERNKPETIIIDKDDLYIDDQGKRWVTAKIVSKIWNHRAEFEYDFPGTEYDRFSVRSRRSDMRERYAEGRPSRVDENEYTLPSIKILGSHLYGEEEAWTIPLHPRKNARLDIKDREVPPKKGEKGRFVSKREASS